MGILNSLNLRSKLIAAMLAAGALTGLTQAWLGNENVKFGFEERLDGRLKALAAMTNNQVELYFQNVRGLTESLSSNLMIVEALDAFGSGMASISSQEVTPEMDAAVQGFYETKFAPQLAKVSDGEPVAQAFVPEQPNARYLQYHYIVSNAADLNTKDQLTKAADGSAYSSTHERYHPGLRALSKGANFADLLLISPNGDVIYSVGKETDFATNLVFGPHNDTGLAKAFRAARERRSTRPVVIEDFSFYEPSYGKPSAFVATPVFQGKDFKGVVAVQLTADRLNTIITKDKGWASIGLGETGDIYIVGIDGLYRTTSRPFEVDRAAFLTQSATGGTEDKVIERMKTFETPIMLQSSRSADAARSGAGGDSQILRNALGKEVRSFAAPLKIDGLDWITVAEVPVEEASRPIVDFQRLMMIALAITTAMTTVAAMILSGLLAKPLKFLTSRLAAASEGDLETPLSLDRKDEMGDVSRSAQALVDSFRHRLEATERERQSTATLLNRFLPDGVVRLIASRRTRTEAGADNLDNISEIVPNATYILGKLSGYEGMLSSLPPDQAVKTLDQLVQVVDVAAEKHGVEKVRTAGDHYFAISGLSTPHLDHRQRGLAFARELHNIVERFRRDNGVNLQVKIGVSSGAAISGVIGRQKLAFDIWGQPVSECEHMNVVAQPGEIRVTAEFANAMKDTERFVPSPDAGKPGMLLVIDADADAAAAPQKKKTKG